tara:strand:+ start:32 stop:877 length:846 start_codon:yes stop_codon:yes gene_type:complete
MIKENKPKVSVVIPVYKPNEKIFSKVKEMIKNQTIKIELIEVWNNPEAVSMNKGIKKAKGDIVITLAQDCVPQNKYWIEKLIKPLENKNIAISVSDLNLPEEFWDKEYSFLTKILSINELGVRRPPMDARACAYRKKELVELGMFNEDPKTIAIDSDLYVKFKKIGKIAHPGCVVDHLHSLTNSQKIRMFYNYSGANGKLIRLYKGSVSNPHLRILRSIPILGLLPIFYVFPYRKLRHLVYLPLYTLLAPFQHLIELYGFWEGFFFNKESMRNKEVLQGKK